MLDQEGVGLRRVLRRDRHDEILRVAMANGCGIRRVIRAMSSSLARRAIAGMSCGAGARSSSRRVSMTGRGLDDAHGSSPRYAVRLLGGLGRTSRRGNANGEPGDPDSPRKYFPGPDRLLLVRSNAIRDFRFRVTRRRAPVGVVVRRKNRHVTTAVGFLGEFHRAVLEREQGVVAAHADVFTGVEGRAALAHDDVAGQHVLAAESSSRQGVWTRSRDRYATNHRISCEPSGRSLSRTVLRLRRSRRALQPSSPGPSWRVGSFRRPRRRRVRRHDR